MRILHSPRPSPPHVIIGIGVDIAEVDRYRFDDAKLARFAKKVFTEAEIAHAMRYRYPAERLAGAYAAKEATRKAFGHAIPWRLVGVRHHRSGRPYIELQGKAPVHLKAGDVFIVESGAKGTWTVHEDMRKYYVFALGH